MYVGVILEVDLDTDSVQSIPHVCGGDPSGSLGTSSSKKYSPCMWG